MNPFFKVVILLVSTSLLVACDLELDDSDDDADSDALQSRIELISGVYNAKRDDDEHYIHIDTSGLMTAYNYEGDSVDNGLNCYSVSEITPTDGTIMNAMFTGMTVTIEEGSDLYKASYADDPDSDVLSFLYTVGVGWNTFTFGGYTSRNGIDNRGVNGLNFRLGDNYNLMQLSSPSIEDIKGALCG